jgi:hypothetical protein
MSSEVPARSHHNFWLGLFLAIGLIISTLIVSGTVSQVKLANQTITVKGYAEKRIRSDLIVWRGNFTARSAQIKEAYRILAADLVKVKEYLSSKGVAPDEVTVTSIETRTLYRRDEQGRPTDDITGYELLQGVEITSVEVDKVTTIARKSTELIEKGVLFHSRPPQYLYTRLSDVKIEMVAEATKDARERAQQLAVNSGSKIGTLRSATMGVFQITRAHSTEISGYGMYDTSSLEKDIKAVVTVSFSID